MTFYPSHRPSFGFAKQLRLLKERIYELIISLHTYVVAKKTSANQVAKELIIDNALQLFNVFDNTLLSSVRR